LIDPSARGFAGAFLGLNDCSKASVTDTGRDLAYAFINEIFRMECYAIAITMKLDANPMTVVLQPTLREQA
jgi:hypothetical protein